MLTDEQFERLPVLFQDIINLDWLIDEAISDEVPDLVLIRDLRAERATLRRAAAGSYGHTIRGDNDHWA